MKNMSEKRNLNGKAMYELVDKIFEKIKTVDKEEFIKNIESVKGPYSFITEIYRDHIKILSKRFDNLHEIYSKKEAYYIRRNENIEEELKNPNLTKEEKIKLEEERASNQERLDKCTEEYSENDQAIMNECKEFLKGLGVAALTVLYMMTQISQRKSSN